MSSTVVITWAECLVCHAEGLARPEHNGRRRTGTDRTSEELERTKGLSVDEICSKGLLRQRSATAAPAQPTKKARTRRATPRVAKTPPAVAPVPTSTVSPAPAPTRTETPAATRDVQTCANCGKRFYGKAREGRCKVCFDYRKQHDTDRQHTHPTPDIIVGAPTLGHGHVRYVRAVS